MRIIVNERFQRDNYRTEEWSKFHHVHGMDENVPNFDTNLDHVAIVHAQGRVQNCHDLETVRSDPFGANKTDYLTETLQGVLLL